MGQKQQNYTIMNSILTISHVDQLIFQLLHQVDEQIDKAALLRNIPAFTSLEIFTLVYSITNLETIHPPQKTPLREENIVEIARLDKDTLMPKDLSQQRVRVQSPRRTSPQSSASSMRKIGFQKRQSSNLMGKLQSVSFTEKKQFRRSSKKVDASVYQQLKSEEDQPELIDVEKLRQRTEARLLQVQALAKAKQERQKLFQSKLDQLNHIREDPKMQNVTYDYGGDALGSNMGQYENLKVNFTRTGLGFATKRLKQGLAQINPPQQCKIQIRPRNAKSYKEESQGALRPLQMPLFPMKFVDGHEQKNLKLDQYKKFYGHKYNRLDQRNHTIDMNKTAKSTQKQETNMENKVIKDADNEQHTFTEKARMTHRKLALPRLNGKYKVLDRYEG